jgi:hypothetical protein
MAEVLQARPLTRLSSSACSGCQSSPQHRTESMKRFAMLVDCMVVLAQGATE